MSDKKLWEAFIELEKKLSASQQREKELIARIKQLEAELDELIGANALTGSRGYER